MINYIISSILFLRLMDIAKEMTRESLPIKCLEAVILGMYPSLWNSLKHGLNILSIYNENNRGPNTEPCGTTKSILHLWFDFHFQTIQTILMLIHKSNLSKGMPWPLVSKEALQSNSTRKKQHVTLTSAVFVPWPKYWFKL